MEGVTEYDRFIVPIEIHFPKGKICCEWCNLSYRNRKGHIACSLSGEEMLSPAETIGFLCPIKKEES